MKRIVVVVFLALVTQRVDAQPDEDVQQPEPPTDAPADPPAPAPTDAPADAPAPAPPPTVTSAPTKSEPPVATSRPAERSLLREAGYGALFGIGAAGAVALTAVIACWRCTTTSPQETALALGVVGGYVAGSIGFGAGVAYAGNRDGVVGSRGAAIGGAFLGMFTGALAGALVHRADAHVHSDTGHLLVQGLTGTAFVAGWLGGALLGFELTRHTPSPQLGALIRLDGGTARLGVPLIVSSRDGTSLMLAAGCF